MGSARLTLLNKYVAVALVEEYPHGNTQSPDPKH